MARCNCSGLVCSCRIVAGDNVTITGSGSAENPLVISAAGGDGSGGGDGVPTGVWFPFGGTAAPAGYLMCNGQAVNRTTFANLFAVIGTRFGAGDGATTFNVPQAVNRVPIGAGGSYPAGNMGGTASTTLVIANLPPHQHSIAHTHSIQHGHPDSETSSGGGHRHAIQNSNDDSQPNVNSLRRAGSSGATDNNNPVETTGSHSHNLTIRQFTGNSQASNTANSGSNAASPGTQMQASSFSNIPPYVATNFIIKT